MDPVRRVIGYLVDNIGHMTRPGNPSFDPVTQRWFVPIRLRTENGDVVLGDIELDQDGHIVYAPCREELVKRADEVLARLKRTGPEVPAAASA